MEEFEGKNRTNRIRNRNRKLREKGIVREKRIKAVNSGGRYNPTVVEVDDEIVDLRFVKSRSDLPV